MRKHLRAGRVDRVIEAVRALCRGRNAAKMRAEIAYFESRRAAASSCATQRSEGAASRGSGAVESAIRRIVNLRLKGASIFWRGPNARALLHW